MSERPGERVVPVSVLNRLAREVLEAGFALLWVGGEISNLTCAASGHVYFSLKDESAQVRCVMFRGRAQILPFRLANGMRVEVRALVTLYEPRGDFQLNVDTLRRAGVGALYEAYARLRDKLSAEGLFEAARKRPLPRYPRCLGVVTSLKAAALRDVLAAVRRRSPNLPVIVYPAAVQGEQAPRELAAALQAAGARAECDVLILCRGGGSIEDLWAFNDEGLARAVAACPVPVVCGVGHETDATIADFVADLRAATPTAAAEIVTAGYAEAGALLGRQSDRLRRALSRRLETLQQRLDLAANRLVAPAERVARLRLNLDHLALRLGAAARRRHDAMAARLAQSRARFVALRPRLDVPNARLVDLARRLDAAAERALARRSERLASLQTQLDHLNPRLVLGRGYAIVRDAGGTAVRDSRQAPAGTRLSLEFAVGTADATVTRSD
ncbi:MAG TPA: exodeoxyribonuclease VII large subunit [Rhodocyclaceae bacterium]|nr:exodeoxyribonuclease VII large subunit [Rhodocyclaceae bacterium]